MLQKLHNTLTVKLLTTFPIHTVQVGRNIYELKLIKTEFIDFCFCLAN